MPQQHRSYSRLNLFLSCGRAYYLRYIQQVPETPAIYLESGKAFHKVVEDYDRGRLLREKEGGDT